jgi:diaminopimelate epimerase
LAAGSRTSAPIALYSAAGNAFHVWDGFAAPPPLDPALLAIELCRASGRDGLLLVLPEVGVDARMVLYNKDGSRAETCGNGLRCVAKLVAEKRSPSTSLRVLTDVGVSAIEVEFANDRVVRATADMGRARSLERACIEVAGETLSATLVDMGNPHCVVFGDAALLARLPELGPLLERHGRFPHRTNVELAMVTPGAIVARVFERGVGETLACGSGACSIALAAMDRGGPDWPITVEMPGGRLVVSFREGRLRLAGPVE